MKILNRVKNAIAGFKSEVDLNDSELLEWLGIKKGSGLRGQEVTAYTCLKMLCEGIAKMPIKYYQDTSDRGRIRAKPDDTSYAFTVRPNKFMTPSTFWGTVEMNRLLYGNAYVLVRKTQKKAGRYIIGEEVQDLWILRSDRTRVIIDNKGIFKNKGEMYYMYSDEYSGETYFYNSDEVMHFKTFDTKNGIVGKSVFDALASTIEGAKESQNFMNTLYKEGLTASMALQFTGDLDDKHITKLQNKYSKYLTGSKNAGKIVPVPIGLELKPLDVKLTDAQFFELKKFSALQIAGVFGIKPNQINNYEKSSYANSESQNLSFLVDTMLYILKQYEEEINYKSLDYSKILEGKFFKFNEKTILRVDSKTQMEILSKGVNNGIYTINAACDYLDQPHVKCGDIPIVNGNYIPLTEVGKQYNKGEGENSD